MSAKPSLLAMRPRSVAPRSSGRGRSSRRPADRRSAPLGAPDARAACARGLPRAPSRTSAKSPRAFGGIRAARDPNPHPPCLVDPAGGLEIARPAIADATILRDVDGVAGRSVAIACSAGYQDAPRPLEVAGPRGRGARGEQRHHQDGRDLEASRGRSAPSAGEAGASRAIVGRRVDKASLRQ